MSTFDWPRIAVVGAGAVGGYFGGMLARSGAPVMFIGRAAFVDAVTLDGLFLDTVQFQERLKAQASIELSAARRGNSLVLREDHGHRGYRTRVAQVLAPGAIVVSMQNGVDNAEQIRAASGLEALAAAVYVAASVPTPGTVRHVGRGDLVLGPQNKITERVASVFTRAGVPCKISENLAGELWTKLVWNCALNAISALGKATYGGILASDDAKNFTTGVEVLAVARSRVFPADFADPKRCRCYKVPADGRHPQFHGTGHDARQKNRNRLTERIYRAQGRGELGVPTADQPRARALVKLWKRPVTAQRRGHLRHCVRNDGQPKLFARGA